MDLETTGKPNTIVSFFGIQDDLPVMASLSEMSQDEFVDTAELLSNDQSQDGTKAIEHYMAEKFPNEYNRTKIIDRFGE